MFGLKYKVTVNLAICALADTYRAEENAVRYTDTILVTRRNPNKIQVSTIHKDFYVRLIRNYQNKMATI